MRKERACGKVVDNRSWLKEQAWRAPRERLNVVERRVECDHLFTRMGSRCVRCRAKG